MGRLKLAIADCDEGYAEALSDFLMSRYPGRFQISSFTGREQLDAYFTAGGKADVLLANPIICNGAVSGGMAGITLLLSETKSSQAEGNPAGGPLDSLSEERPAASIFKYRHGDILAGEIMEAVSGKLHCKGAVPANGRRTRITAVYSPAGGTGKTSVAVSSSVLCAKGGLSVFYLDLESLQTAPAFFHSDHGYSLSRVIYRLKEKNKSLNGMYNRGGLLLESVMSIDTATGVEFFQPPESALELEELLPGEMACLVEQFRVLGRHDVVFIDMQGGFDSRSAALLEACDEIFLVVTQDFLCQSKLKAFDSELERMPEGVGASLWSKSTILLNKCREGLMGAYGEGYGNEFADAAFSVPEGSMFVKKAVSVRLPELRGPLDPADAWKTSGTDSGFYAGIKRLVKRYFSEDSRVQYGE